MTFLKKLCDIPHGYNNFAKNRNEAAERLFAFIGMPDKNKDRFYYQRCLQFVDQNNPNTKSKFKLNSLSVCNKHFLSFMSGLLDVNSEQRLSLEEALVHPFFSQKGFFYTEHFLQFVQENGNLYLNCYMLRENNTLSSILESVDLLFIGTEHSQLFSSKKASLKDVQSIEKDNEKNSLKFRVAFNLQEMDNAKLKKFIIEKGL